MKKLTNVLFNQYIEDVYHVNPLCKQFGLSINVQFKQEVLSKPLFNFKDSQSRSENYRFQSTTRPTPPKLNQKISGSGANIAPTQMMKPLPAGNRVTKSPPKQPKHEPIGLVSNNVAAKKSDGPKRPMLPSKPLAVSNSAGYLHATT